MAHARQSFAEHHQASGMDRTATMMKTLSTEQRAAKTHAHVLDNLNEMDITRRRSHKETMGQWKDIATALQPRTTIRIEEEITRTPTSRTSGIKCKECRSDKIT